MLSCCAFNASCSEDAGKPVLMLAITFRHMRMHAPTALGTPGCGEQGCFPQATTPRALARVQVRCPLRPAVTEPAPQGASQPMGLRSRSSAQAAGTRLGPPPQSRPTASFSPTACNEHGRRFYPAKASDEATTEACSQSTAQHCHSTKKAMTRQLAWTIMADQVWGGLGSRLGRDGLREQGKGRRCLAM